MTDTNRIAATPIQKVVVVNGRTDELGMLEAVLDAGRYDVVFIESNHQGYSQIKQMLPDLVILCACVEHLEGVQLLTMLKLDPATRDIPILEIAGHSAAAASRPAALHLPHICPIFSVVAPCRPGASTPSVHQLFPGHYTRFHGQQALKSAYRTFRCSR
ncbi:MAG: hypothetical protein HW394_1770 [Acidobacteria bacterium]|nr:hypothetical protein [Acidobacteriota bacterium]